VNGPRTLKDKIRPAIPLHSLGTGSHRVTDPTERGKDRECATHVSPHIDALELPFEYCALRFLIQWEQRERALHEQIAGHPSLQHVRAALSYFQVSRTFADLASDEAAQAVLDALRQVDAESQLSPEEKVERLAARFKERFNQCNLSAASKLFWLKHRWPYIIHDSRSVHALRELGDDFGTPNYSEYCSSWRNQFNRHEVAIRNAASRLHEIRPFVRPWQRTDAELTALASQPWFLERIFDTYLWEMGSDPFTANDVHESPNVVCGN
jgi:hypothetical protein